MIQNSKKPILLVAGEGGHLEQARRFSVLDASDDNPKFIVVTDDQLNNIPFQCQVERNKNISSYTKVRTVANLTLFFFLFAIHFFKSLYFILKVRPSGVVAFGPAFCFPYIFWARLLGFKTVYIETWSKFYEPSITAKISQKISHRIYIQNSTLKEKLPKAIYGGRL